MQIKEYLKNLKIEYKAYIHPAVYTVAESEKHKIELKSPINKTLFLKSKKPLTENSKKYYLVILPGNKRLNLKELEQKLNEKITFASEQELKEILNLYPGAVSPFGLINNKDSKVELIIDKESLTSELISFHPNINTETIELTQQDFKKYLDTLKNKVIII